MSKSGRCSLMMLAVLVWPIIGCERQAASPPVEDPIEVAQPALDTDDQGPEAQEPEVAPGHMPAGAELRLFLERLDRLERAQRQMQAGLPRLAYPELEADMLTRIGVAHKQLRTAHKGVAGLPDGEGLGDMLNLMSLALTELSGQAEPCPEPGERLEFLKAAQQQLEDARSWVEESPDNPNSDVLSALLTSAQEDLHRAKSGECIGMIER